MGLLGDLFNIGSAIVGHGSDKKKNKRAKEQLQMDKDLANRQIEISKYIEEYAKKVAALNGDFYDASGGRAVYNPETGRYETHLGPRSQQIQDASDTEELARYTMDQAIRRAGLSDFEQMRERSVGEADTALRNVNAFRRGVGRVDADRIGSQLRADRTQAINAGYDDAERAAQTLQLRTGSSAVGDALSSLARDRVRAMATVGSPEIEALTLADQINQGRQSQLFDIYQLFGNEGRGFYDAGFNPSTRAAEADARLADRMKFDLSKYDLAMGGQGTAAATIGNAAAGLRQGYNQSEANRIHAPTAKLLQGVGENADNFLSRILSLGKGP